MKIDAQIQHTKPKDIKEILATPQIFPVVFNLHNNYKQNLETNHYSVCQFNNNFEGEIDMNKSLATEKYSSLHSFTGDLPLEKTFKIADNTQKSRLISTSEIRLNDNGVYILDQVEKQTPIWKPRLEVYCDSRIGTQDLGFEFTILTTYFYKYYSPVQNINQEIQ